MERVSFSCPGTEVALEQSTVTNEPDDLLAANIELFCHASVPFSNRSRYLFGDNMPDNDWVPLLAVAKKVGEDPFTVYDLIDDLHVPENHRYIGDDSILQLSAATVVVVREEYRWRQMYEETAEEVTAPQIAALFETSIDHIENLMQRIGVAPRIVNEGTFGTAYLYPKELLHRVRAEVMMFPVAHESRKTRAQIIGELGCGYNWINRRIDNDDAECARRRVLCKTFRRPAQSRKGSISPNSR
jgi:rubrerythrin